jgi:assimilatory nitrate reductase catalytic subunit
MICGTNVSETFPTLTHYIWQARDNGAKLIVVDPRITPIARTADLHLPIKPGTDSALYGAMLKILVDNDWLDHEFIKNYTSGFEETIAAVKDYDLDWAEKITGIAKEKILQAATWWGKTATSFLLHARGIEHHSKGVDNVVGCINLVLATGRIGKPYCGYGTITGQGNGQGGREHGHKCDQLPGQPRHHQSRTPKIHLPVFGALMKRKCLAKDFPRMKLSKPLIGEKLKGSFRFALNPLVSLPNSNYVREALEKLEYYVTIDFFLSETARYADVVMAGSLHEEDEGTVTTAEGRVVRINAAVTPPGNARKDSDIIMELAKRLGAGDKFNFENSEAAFNELRVASKGGTADYYGITYQKIEENMGIFWPCPSEDHPGTPRLWEDRKFKTPDGKAHFNAAPYRDPGEVTDSEYPIVLTTGRVVSQYLSGSQTRRIGKLVDQYAEPLLEIHPKLATMYGITEGDLINVVTRRGEAVFPAQLVETIREDTVFIPYHWGGSKSANLLTPGTLDPHF